MNIAGTDWQFSKQIQIGSIEQLRTALMRLSEEKPGMVELCSRSGNRLQIGIGGKFACAQFLNHANLPPYLFAKAKIIHSKAEVSFLMGGTPTPVASEHCLSINEALKIAEYFFERDGPEPDTAWVEV